MSDSLDFGPYEDHPSRRRDRSDELCLLAVIDQIIPLAQHPDKCGWWDSKYPGVGMFHHDGVCDCGIEKAKTLVADIRREIG